MLSRHKEIDSPRETAFFHLLAGASRSEKKDAEKFWDFYKRHRRFIYLGVSSAEVESNFCKPLTHRGIFEAVLSALKNRTGKKHIIEKTPGHERYHRVISTWFPDAVFLGIVRDPRAVALSLSKTPWGTHDPYVCAKLWNRSASLLLQLERKGILFLTRYEDLVNAPGEVIDAICDRLNVPYTSDLIHASTQEDSLPSDSSWLLQHELKAKAIVSTQSVSKWKVELIANNVSVIEALCQGHMQMLGYEIASKSGRLPIGYLRKMHLVLYSHVRAIIDRCRKAVSDGRS